jgi:hypothetical protein
MPLPVTATRYALALALVIDATGHPVAAASSDLADRTLYFRWSGRTWQRQYGPGRPNGIEVDVHALTRMPDGALLSVGQQETLGPMPRSAISEIGGLADDGAAAIRPTAGARAPAAAGAPPGSGAQGNGWTVVEAPPSQPQTSLAAVTALDSHDAWAAGQYYTGRVASGFPLILHYDGIGWRRMPLWGITWHGQLTSVTASSRGDVWAIGSDAFGFAHIVHRDRGRWADVPFPGQGNTHVTLTKIAAARGAAPWIIGYNDAGPVLLRRTGAAWESVTPPAGTSTLTAIHVTGQHDAWVATTQPDPDPQFPGWPETVIAYWDGTSWTQLPGLGPLTYVNDFLVGGPGNIWAAGNFGVVGAGGNGPSPLLEHWDGSTWKDIPTPYSAATLISISGEDGTPQWITPSVNSNLSPYPPSGQTPYLHYNGASFGIVYGPQVANQSSEGVVLAHVPGTSTTLAVGQAGYYNGFVPRIEQTSEP